MSDPKKVNLKSKNITEETLEELKRLVPSAFKEGKIDFDALKNVLGDVVEPSREFYNFTWAGKSEAFRTLQRPSTATLKPCIEESKEWDKTENLFIEGDNLEVLKLLQKTYHNSIKMIYIDPPYNKDKDFVYPDRWSEGIKSYKEFCGFVDGDGNITTSEDEAKNAAGRKHSRWLTMMYPRLFLARNLLKDDGVIFVSIDDDEAANLKKVMDEIFGEENFVAQLSVVNNIAGRSDKKHIATGHEYVMVYQKSNMFNSTGLPLTAEQLQDYRFKDSDGIYRIQGLRKRGSGARREDRPNMYYPIYYDIDSNSISLDKNQFSNAVEILPKLSDGSDGRWRWGKKTFEEKKNLLEVKKIERRDEYDVYEKVYFESEDGEKTTKMKSYLLDSDYTTDVATSEFSDFMEPKIFDNPKPIQLIVDFMAVANDKNAIVLDFFSGSGTTAHAAMALNAEDGGNRKFICVQIPEKTYQLVDNKEVAKKGSEEAFKANYKTIAQITKKRIRRAGDKVKADNPLFAGDIGFKVFKLDESNFKQWDKEVADVETLKQQIIDFADNVAHGADKTDMLYELLLKKGYNLNAKVESRQIADNEIFVVDDSMFVCLDESVSIATIDEIINLRPAHFIVLDKAFLGADQLKTNTWQTFKSLFPNDENPFETV